MFSHLSAFVPQDATEGHGSLASPFDSPIVRLVYRLVPSSSENVGAASRTAPLLLPSTHLPKMDMLALDVFLPPTFSVCNSDSLGSWSIHLAVSL